MPILLKPTEKMQHSQDALNLIFFTGEGEHLLSPCLREEGVGDRLVCSGVGQPLPCLCQHELPCLVPYKHTGGKKCS